MNRKTGTLYRAREFAGLTGVTVRTLHHYDRIGLLKPSGRTPAGYRLYGERDFARLQQIATLKFIGLPLREIKGLLERHTLDLAATLRLQREIIENQRRRLDMALAAIERADAVVASGAGREWEAFRKIIEVISMENNMEWTEKYYSEEAREKLSEKRASVPREVVEQGQHDWATLIVEVEAAVVAGVDPASEHAQGLAARWSKLIEAFTGGDRAITEGLNKLYADQSNWPSTFPKPYSDEAGAFICQAAASKKG